MRKLALYCFCFLFFVPVLVTSSAQAQHGALSPGDTAVYEDPDAWARDFAALYDRVREVHPEYDSAHDAAVWDAQYDATQAAIPDMDWAEFVTAAAQFMNLAEDGHTNVFPFAYHGPGFQTEYPLRVYLFDEGLFVTRIAEEGRAIAGGRVLQIGDMTADEVMGELMGLISAGSPMWKVNFAPVILRYPGFASVLGYGDADGGLTITVETPGGDIAAATIEPQDEVDASSLVTAFDALNPQADFPRWMTEEAPYTYDYLPEQNAVYLIYGAVASDEDNPIDAFAAEMFAFIEENEVDRLVIDVRNNGGGDNTFNAPFVHGAIASRVNRPGGIYVLTGRQTFSAAQNFSNWMERHTQALFVGEPTGGRPNHFGDAEIYPLPESQLVTLISTLRWQDSFDSDTRPWIRPDVAVPLSFGAFIAGRDPVLGAALTHDATDIAFEPFTARRWHRDTQYQGWDVPVIGARGVFDEDGNEVR